MNLDQSSRMNNDIIGLVQKDLDLFVKLGIVFEESSIHTNIWNRRYVSYRKKFIDNDFHVISDRLKEFSKHRIFVSDNPRTDVNGWSLKNIFWGDLRGERRVLHICLEILKANGFEYLLEKYPVPTVGSPFVFNYKGYCFTHRWSRMIYQLGLMNKYLAGDLVPGFTALDIGSHCGMFSSLVYQEYPGSTQVLVDLPESLLLARYFLTSCFPDAKIAGIQEFSHLKTITRSFLKQYDFILIPPQFYENLESGSVDLITSFACLGEMKRAYFDYYIESPVFRNAKFFFTVNPVDTSSWFRDSDLSILDYPFWGNNRKLHFRLSPIFFHSYSRPKRRYVFFYRLSPFHTFFEYIGEIDATSDSESAGQSQDTPK